MPPLQQRPPSLHTKTLITDLQPGLHLLKTWLSTSGRVRSFSLFATVSLAAVFLAIFLGFVRASARGLAPAGLADPTWSPVSLALTIDPFSALDMDLELAAQSRLALDDSILGGEREQVLLANGKAYIWDGSEGDPQQLDASGLGGMDLGLDGWRDHFVLRFLPGAAASRVVFQVIEAEERVSVWHGSIPSGSEEMVSLVVPFDEFQSLSGQGADFSQAGALVLEVVGPARPLSVAADSSLNIFHAQSPAENAFPQAQAGELVTHKVRVENPTGRSMGGLHYRLEIPGRFASLIPDSISAANARLVSGSDQGFVIRLGGLAAGESAEITYQTRQKAAIVPADLILQDGDTPPGAGGNPVSLLNLPFTDGEGKVGFTGALDTGGGTDAFIWYDTGILWRNSDSLTPTLSGAEAFMGVGDGARFIYSPAVNGEDAVWTHNGLLQVENIQAPGFPPGTNNTFNSRPTMQPGGGADWVSGFNETGGTATEGRIFYHAADATTGTISVVLRSDDVISGFIIDRPSGIGFDYSVSDNGAHHLQEILMDTGSTVDDAFMYLDGGLIAREGQPSGQGDNWDNFDLAAINDSGNFLFSGDTDGATTTDEFIAYNGSIVIREGDVVAGIPLASSAAVRLLSLNNLGHAVYAWGVAGGAEYVFVACDASALSDAYVALATGDMLDLDGNGTGDASVTDINTFGASTSLAEDGSLYLEVDLNYGGADLEAVVRLDLACGAIPAISLNKTVGLDPQVCAPADVLDVPSGTQVTYCYEVTNTGDLTLTRHNLNDSRLGALLTDFIFSLLPGNSVFVTATAAVTQTTVNSATWTAFNPGPVDVVQATDSATVQVLTAALKLTKTVGLDTGGCALDSNLTVRPGTAVTYCYRVANSGPVTLTHHDLDDSQLGFLLSGFVFDLGPGTSIFLTQTALLTETTVNTATWTANDSLFTAAAMDSASVTVEPYPLYLPVVARQSSP